MPISPHLPIYRVQITSFLSITHRLTELFIYGTGAFFALTLVIVACTPFLETSFSDYAPFVSMGTYLLSIGLAYHLTSTLRYVFWDMGYGFDHVSLTGWLSVIGAFFLGIVPFFL